MTDIIIIGGGAAGMMAAIGAADTFKKEGREGSIQILEKMPRPGRKIMITGKGRCNLTNLKDWNEFSGHVHPKANMLKPAFFNMSAEKTVGLFNTAGLETVTEHGDRVFPASYISSDVVDTLTAAIERSGARLVTGCEVSSIESTGEAYSIKCRNGKTFTAGKVIIATGGLSYPRTGSTGDGYIWAADLGHKIKECFPSLTAVVPRFYKDLSVKQEDTEPENRYAILDRGHVDRSTPLSDTGKCLEGIQLKNVAVTLVTDGNPVQEEFGDLDFTDGGIEGPLGFRISRKCVSALLNGSKVYVILDLKPAVNTDALNARISKLWQEIATDRRSAGKQYKDRFRILLLKVMPASLVQGFLRCNPSADHKTLARLLKEWKMEISGYVGYERCVITAGGISSEDITAKTLESKVCPGLYFAGEILDIDGDTGGYNLQIAFSTGYLAGCSAAKTASRTEG